MFKFIGKALARLVLTSEARRAVGRRVGGKRPQTLTGKPAAQAAAEAQVQAQAVVTPDRAELIRQAMKVRAAKQSILADLDDETRAKLVATAMRALLNEGRKKQ